MEHVFAKLEVYNNEIEEVTGRTYIIVRILRWEGRNLGARANSNGTKLLKTHGFHTSIPLKITIA